MITLDCCKRTAGTIRRIKMINANAFAVQLHEACLPAMIWWRTERVTETRDAAERDLIRRQDAAGIERLPI